MNTLRGLGILIAIIVIVITIYVLIYKKTAKLTLKQAFLNSFTIKLWKNRTQYLRWSLPLTFISALIVGYIFFLLFSVNLGSTSAYLYDTSYTVDQVDEVGNQIWNVINNSNFMPGTIVCIVLVALLIGYDIYLAIKKQLTFNYIVISIVSIALITALSYSYVTNNIMVRQYDTWTTSQNGHLAITCSIYRYNTIPDPRSFGTYADGYPVMDYAYQLYQPKLAYFVNAIWMHISDFIIGKDMYTSYQSIKVLNFALFACELLLAYKAVKMISNNKIIALVGMAFVAFAPQLIRFTASSSNEPLYTFFLILGVYLLIRFYKANNYLNLCLCGFSIGLAMACRITAVWLLIPGIAVIVLISIFHIKDHKISTGFEYSITFLFCALVIGLICPLYQKIAWNQPINYVWAYLNDGLKIGDSVSYIDHFLYFDFAKYFSHIYMNMWKSDVLSMSAFDSNFMVAALRTSIFGEFNYGSNPFAYILWIGGFMFFIVFFLALLAINMKLLIKKKFTLPLLTLLSVCVFFLVTFLNGMLYERYDDYRVGFEVCFILMLFAVILTSIAIIKNKVINKQTLPFIVMLVVGVTFICAYQNFNADYPYTCSQDFKVYGILLIPFAYAIGLLIYKGITLKNKKLSKTAIIISSIMFFTYILGSVGLYISIGILS